MTEHCKSCGVVGQLATRERVFADQTNHVELYCAACDGHQQWVPRGVDPRSFVVPCGKHKGRTVGEVISSDPSYARWAAEKATGNWARKFAEALR